MTEQRAQIKIVIIVTFIFHCFFNSLARYRYLSFFSLSFSVNLWLTEIATSVFLLIFTKSGHLVEIRRSVFISKSRSLSISFSCVVHIPFLRKIKLKFLAQLPVDLLAYLVVFSLIFFLCQFAAFGYYVIDLFISAVLLSLISSCFDLICTYDVVLCCSQKRFSFSLKVSLAHPCPRLLV